MTEKTARPLRVLQFGGGVFLRGFFDWMLQKANDCGAFCGDALIVRSRTRGADPLAENHFRYTHIAADAAHRDVTEVNCVRGSVCPAEDWAGFLSTAENEEIEVVVSNTTERGIEYRPCPYLPETCPESYPAKLTHWLYRRYSKGGRGVLILPLELIERNGDTLREYVLRHAADFALPAAFADWVRSECSFRNTLVDRIVSGSREGEPTINRSEYFHLFVIEGQPDARLPFDKAGLNVRFVPSVVPFRTRKVRLLNGAHTSMIPYALLLHTETVFDCMQSPVLSAHLSRCMEEIIVSLGEEREEAERYAADVCERFRNPEIAHRCRAIALSSLAKFRVRVVPSILGYVEKTGKAPTALLTAFAKLIVFYRTDEPEDDPEDIRRVRELPLPELLADTALWGADLSRFAGEVSALENS